MKQKFIALVIKLAMKSSTLKKAMLFLQGAAFMAHVRRFMGYKFLDIKHVVLYKNF